MLVSALSRSCWSATIFHVTSLDTANEKKNQDTSSSQYLLHMIYDWKSISKHPVLSKLEFHRTISFLWSTVLYVSPENFLTIQISTVQCPLARRRTSQYHPWSISLVSSHEFFNDSDDIVLGLINIYIYFIILEAWTWTDIFYSSTWAI